VHTVAVVGYASACLGGGLLAALIAFAPSFSFILIGAERVDRLRANQHVRAFLNGADPAAIGAIAGALRLQGIPQRLDRGPGPRSPVPCTVDPRDPAVGVDDRDPAELQHVEGRAARAFHRDEVFSRADSKPDAMQLDRHGIGC
jgi:hypothetical protein